MDTEIDRIRRLEADEIFAQLLAMGITTFEIDEIIQSLKDNEDDSRVVLDILINRSQMSPVGGDSMEIPQSMPHEVHSSVSNHHWNSRADEMQIANLASSDSVAAAAAPTSVSSSSSSSPSSSSSSSLSVPASSLVEAAIAAVAASSSGSIPASPHMTATAALSASTVSSPAMQYDDKESAIVTLQNELSRVYWEKEILLEDYQARVKKIHAESSETLNHALLNCRDDASTVQVYHTCETSYNTAIERLQSEYHPNLLRLQADEERLREELATLLDKEAEPDESPPSRPALPGQTTPSVTKAYAITAMETSGSSTVVSMLPISTNSDALLVLDTKASPVVVSAQEILGIPTDKSGEVKSELGSVVEVDFYLEESDDGRITVRYIQPPPIPYKELLKRSKHAESVDSAVGRPSQAVSGADYASRPSNSSNSRRQESIPSQSQGVRNVERMSASNSQETKYDPAIREFTHKSPQERHPQQSKQFVQGSQYQNHHASPWQNRNQVLTHLQHHPPAKQGRTFEKFEGKVLNVDAKSSQVLVAPNSQGPKTRTAHLLAWNEIQRSKSDTRAPSRSIVPGQSIVYEGYITSISEKRIAPTLAQLASERKLEVVAFSATKAYLLPLQHSQSSFQARPFEAAGAASGSSYWEKERRVWTEQVPSARWHKHWDVEDREGKVDPTTHRAVGIVDEYDPMVDHGSATVCTGPYAENIVRLNSAHIMLFGDEKLGMISKGSVVDFLVSVDPDTNDLVARDVHILGLPVDPRDLGVKDESEFFVPTHHEPTSLQPGKRKDYTEFPEFGYFLFDHKVSFGEGESVEFKAIPHAHDVRSKIEDHMAKLMCAFANCRGGRLFLGINDSGFVRGVGATASQIDALTRLPAHIARNLIPPLNPILVNIHAVPVYYRIKRGVWVKLEGLTVLVMGVNPSKDVHMYRRPNQPPVAYQRSGASVITLKDNELREFYQIRREWNK